MKTKPKDPIVGGVVRAIKKSTDVGKKLADKVAVKKAYGNLNAAARKDVKKTVNEAEKTAVKHNYASKPQRDFKQEALDRRKAAQQKQIDDSYRKRGGSKLPKAQIGISTKTPKQYLDSVSKANSVKPGKSISRPRYPIPGTSRRFNDAQRDSVIKSWFKKMK